MACRAWYELTLRERALDALQDSHYEALAEHLEREGLTECAQAVTKAMVRNLGRQRTLEEIASIDSAGVAITERVLGAGSTSSWKPPTPEGIDLDRAREQAIRVVCKTLNERADKHVRLAYRGEAVMALRMTDPGANGARYSPAFGDWPGLPGLYSHDWPTTIGLKGEATRELELLTLKPQEVVDVRDKLRKRLSEKRREQMREAGERTISAEPDEAAIWEEVTRAHKLGSRTPVRGRPAWDGARKIQRFAAHANEWEHQFPGSEASTGRKPLPPLR
jgi:hypothetical protein